MKIGIVGGGITGLTAGYKLAKAGHKITIFEKENFLGGLAAGFKRKNWQWSLERFFHHFFVSDQSAVNLIKELNLADKLFYTRPKTSIFKNGKVSQFDSVLSVLAFPHLSLLEKLRVGLTTLYLRSTKTWEKFEKTAAENWLRKYYGKNSYQVLWEPLLKGKFGPFADQISMAWFWARIKKRSSKLGYLKGGLPILTEKLSEKIKEDQGKILLNHEVKSLNDRYYLSKFDRIIVTAPLPVFLKIAPFLPKNYTSRENCCYRSNYRAKLKKLKFIGALNLVLTLSKRFLADGTYWLNINEKGFPFVAVIEHTNFVEPKYYGGEHILYIGGYYSQDHPYFKMSKEEIFKEFLPYLKKINPKFNFSLFTIHYSLFTDLYAQPVMPINYGKIMPEMETPTLNLYLANQFLIYPWDRGVNYAIELGERVAKLVAFT